MPHTDITDPSTGKRWPSVTQISGLCGGGDYLIKWASKHGTLKAAILKDSLLSDYVLGDEFEKRVRDAGLSVDEFWLDAEDLKNRAREIGVAKHEVFEKVMPQLINGSSIDMTDPYVKALVRWMLMRSLKFTEFEKKVMCNEHKFGGTFDALAEKNGRQYLIDWKFTTRLRPSAVLQMAGYDIALSGEPRSGYLIRFSEVKRSSNVDRIVAVKAGTTYQLAGSNVVLEEHFIPNLGDYHGLFFGLRKLWDFMQEYPL